MSRFLFIGLILWLNFLPAALADGSGRNDAAAAPTRQTALLKAAEQALAAGDDLHAVGLFEQASTQSGESVEAELGVVRAHLQGGRFREAFAFANLASGEHPDSQAALALLAYVEDRAGQTERALAKLKQARARLPDDPSLLAAQSAILIDRGAAGRAAAELDAWIATHPPDRELYALRARAARAIGERERAAEWQARATSFDAGAAVRLIPYVQAFPPVTDVESSAGNGVVIDNGRRVVTLARLVKGASQGVWVRNGLGQVRAAQIESLHEREGIAVLRLASPYPKAGSLGPESIADPAAGRGALFVGYPVAESLVPAYPALGAGLVFRAVSADIVQTTLAQTPGLAGAPVFDTQGRWVGLSLGASGGVAGQVLRASAFRALLPAAHAPTPATAASPTFEELYERLLPMVVQVVVVR